MNKIHLGLLSFLIAFNVVADDCQSSLYSLGNALPGLKLPATAFTLDAPIKSDFCFDPKADTSFKKEFEELKKRRHF